MPKSTRVSRVIVAGFALLGAAVIAHALQIAGLVVLLPGLMLCVSGAAMAASNSRRSEGDGSLDRMPPPRRSATITAAVLGVLVFLPFVAVGALMVAGADPLAIFLIGLGVFAVAGVLVVTSIVVFFADGWMDRHRATSTFVDQSS